jgi:hypothetical protein
MLAELKELDESLMGGFTEKSDVVVRHGERTASASFARQYNVMMRETRSAAKMGKIIGRITKLLMEDQRFQKDAPANP